jgi:predicted anti-sigma-YlaC factor YlaD
MAAEVIEASVQMLMRPWVATCEETRERLSDHLEGALPRREHKRVLRHLARCRHCRALLDSLARTLDHLRSLAQLDVPATAPVATADAVIERIRRERR